MKKKMSIRTKTIGYFSLIIIFILVAQILFNLFLLKPIVSYTKTKVIEHTFYELKEDYNGSVDDISELGEYIQNTHSIKVVMYCDDEIIYSTGFSNRQEFDLPVNPNEMPQQLDETKDPKDKPKEKMDRFKDFASNTEDFKEVPSVDTLGLDNDTEQLVLKGKFENSGKEIYVVLTLPMENIESGVRVYGQISSIIMLFALVVGIIIAIAFSKSLTKPITTVERVAQDLSNLDFSTLANENVSTKELASLAKSINSMSGRLKQSIDELQIANENLKKDIDYKNQVEEMRRQFIANVSHEMKTPLGLLQIYCENLKENVDGVDKEYYCNVIIEETQTLNDMVVSMLDISSIESGLSKMVFEKFDMSCLCNEIAEKYKNAYEDINFDYSIESNVEIVGDSKHISQAINNYMQNAISHTNENNKVELKLEKLDDGLKLSVYNEGDLIDKSNIENIWDPFYKSDKARTRNGKNNVGLGLYIVKTIIEKHGGQVDVVNKEDGVEFSFTIKE